MINDLKTTRFGKGKKLWMNKGCGKVLLNRDKERILGNCLKILNSLLEHRINKSYIL